MPGIGAAVFAVLTSGLAGVLCEYLLKAGSRDVTMSIRNIQLGVPSCLLGLVALHFQENEKLVNGGFFQGFTSWTWTVIVLHSLGWVLPIIIQVNHLNHVVSLIHFFHRRLARDSSDEVR
jgi:solute carrier family 35 (UDP-sugar transporter), member A1/2/3